MTDARPGPAPTGAAPRGQGGARPVQARILAAAVQLFARQGFDGTSVQEIVEEAAVTKGAMYHYFSSKDDLLYEIYNQLLSRQLADLDRILAERRAPRETLRAIITELVCTTAGHIDETKVFGREQHKLDDRHAETVRANRRRYHVTFRELIEAAQRDGVFSTMTPAETVTLIVLGVVNELPKWYRPDGPKPAEQIAAEVVTFVLAALDPGARPWRG